MTPCTRVPFETEGILCMRLRTCVSGAIFSLPQGVEWFEVVADAKVLLLRGVDVAVVTGCKVISKELENLFLFFKICLINYYIR